MTRADPNAPIYVLRLKPAAGTDGVKALRWLLKIAWRRLGLKCISIEREGISSKVIQDHLCQPSCHRPKRIDV